MSHAKRCKAPANHCLARPGDGCWQNPPAKLVWGRRVDLTNVESRRLDLNERGCCEIVSGQQGHSDNDGALCVAQRIYRGEVPHMMRMHV